MDIDSPIALALFSKETDDFYSSMRNPKPSGQAPVSHNKRPLSTHYDSPSSLAADLSSKFNFNDSPLLNELFNYSESPLLNRGFRNISNLIDNVLTPKLSSPLHVKDETPLPFLKESKRSLVKSFTQVACPTTRLDDFFSPSPEVSKLTSNFFDDEDEDENPMGSPLQQRKNNKANIRNSIRRTHSMYQSPAEMETKFSMETNSLLHTSNLTTFKVDNDLLPRINENELINVLNGQFLNNWSEFVIVDCRFDYEYEGGHIQGAVNLSTPEALEEYFLASNKENMAKTSPKLLIFHCEFSEKRGPYLASHLRKCDRLINKDNYPNLSYPDIVILSGGYKQFFHKYQSKCYPQGYIEMNHSNYKDSCDSKMGKVRSSIKLTRAKSFNYTSTYSGKSLHQRSNSVTITSYAKNLKILKRQKSTSSVHSKNGSQNSSPIETDKVISLESNSLFHQKSLSLSSFYQKSNKMTDLFEEDTSSRNNNRLDKGFKFPLPRSCSRKSVCNLQSKKSQDSEFEFNSIDSEDGDNWVNSCSKLQQQLKQLE